MQYRTELDGLRAISVMSVILYHAGVSGISAGYAGVDVFFVISGFLIGGQIAKDRANGTFSYRDFYARRARRILPALFLVIICSIIVGWFTMVPQEFRYFGGGAISALLSVSNFWFWDVIDYFNPAAARDPLVHTWSLAVEEQFYLFVPLLFGVLWRFGRKRVFVSLTALALASFATAVLTNSDSPMAAFYLLHARAWELLAGVLAALLHGRVKASGKLAASLSNAGLILTLAGLVLIPGNVDWPGVWTLLPVTGAVMILLFGETPSLSQRLLKLAPLQMIGLISYSAYLWHQPVFSFLEITNHLPDSKAGLALIVAVTLAISFLSWKFVEQPFRKRVFAPAFGRGVLLASACLIIVFSVGGHVTKGYPARMPANVHEVLLYSNSYSGSYRNCLYNREEIAGLDIDQSCVFGADVAPSVAIWGDSHAGAIAEPLGIALGAVGRSLKQFALSSCQPIPNLLNSGQSRAERCAEFNAKVFAKLLDSPDLETVVFFATWDNYFRNGERQNMFGTMEADGFFSYPRGQGPDLPDQERRAGIVRELGTVVGLLTAAGKKVILLASLPSPDVDIPVYFAGEVWNGKPLPDRYGYPVEIFRFQADTGRQMLAEAARGAAHAGRAVVLDPAEIFCDQFECTVIADRKLLFVDGDHPSLAGSAVLVPKIVDQILRSGWPAASVK